MTRRRFDDAVLTVVVVGLAWGAAATQALSETSAVRVGIAGLVGVLAFRLVQQVRGPGDPSIPEEERSPFELAVRSAEVPVLPRSQELERTEALLLAVVSGAADLGVRLGPVLREIAAERLRQRRGVDLDTQPAEARAVLGDQLYEIVRPDRPRSHDRGSIGVPASAIAPLLDALEAV